MFNGIDISSDTATLPTDPMKTAMVEAVLGDEQKGEDPTTLELEEHIAELLGFERALFLPSATMANQVAVRLLCDAGNELIGAENCHIFTSESGGIAVHSGVMRRAIPTKTGVFTAMDLRNAYSSRRGDRYPVPQCIVIENTTNLGGGIAWDLNTLDEVLAVAKELKLKAHLDGARLFNAAVKLGVEPKRLTACFDTVTICLSKGLGCPVGAVLALSEENYEKALRLKHLFGGALRQSGMLAAAGLYALKNNINSLATDHHHAALFAEQLRREIPKIRVENSQHSTNMVFFSWQGEHLSPKQFLEECVKAGFRFSHIEGNRFRAVFHLGIKEQDVYVVIEKLKSIGQAKLSLTEGRVGVLQSKL